MNNLRRFNIRLVLPIFGYHHIPKCGITMCKNSTITSSNFGHHHRLCSNQQDPLGIALLDLVTYETVSSDTLESLCEYFEDLVESTPHLKNADITYSDGVLTINFGGPYGTYVINRQSPNRQIWLSSPTSGPKRYDFIETKKSAGRSSVGYWIYKHEKVTLHELLQNEIRPIVGKEVDFLTLPFGQRQE